MKQYQIKQLKKIQLLHPNDFTQSTFKILKFSTVLKSRFKKYILEN